MSEVQHSPERNDPATFKYLSGFANEHESEAVEGALPQGQFSPQQVPLGLYAEKLSSSAFTVPRHINRRSWFYRIRPSVVQSRFEPTLQGLIRSAPVQEMPPVPNQTRWNPFSPPTNATDFVDGLTTIAANGSAELQVGVAIHMYLCNESMLDRFFYNSDGELLIVPQLGRFRAHTECGVLEVCAGEILVIPRGMKFRVVLPDGESRGYVAENYGASLTLPERGLVGSDGFANDRDFLAPVAAFEDREGDFELVCKFGGNLHRSSIGHSPLDIVAWVGTSFPYKYDLARFNVMGSVSYDHPDPSIYTVLTSSSDTPGVANLDFVVFPPRWIVAENTFRPPWFHRNIMSEFMGLIHGVYDGKQEGFLPGGASLHNCMSAHGPDADVFEKASKADLSPQQSQNTLAFMFESRYPFRMTDYGWNNEARQHDYVDCWKNLKRQYKL
ncbi:MAG: homogentisate 1,2-dioxygenase [Parasphingorhabdus sp.]|jgi:homogentisate 1,2-dioxygenase